MKLLPCKQDTAWTGQARWSTLHRASSCLSFRSLDQHNFADMATVTNCAQLCAVVEPRGRSSTY
eukprot:m.229282 g.229282  ORF g.229282 m.229282 type:complete len:64 (-) comp15206_c1_seq7:225-416(-)